MDENPRTEKGLESLAVSTEFEHNGQSIWEYPSSKYFFIPFPEAKGTPFNSDNLATVNDYSFVRQDDFIHAKEAADRRWPPHSRDISWRLHVFLWCARQSLTLSPKSNWVELGVGKGYNATAILTLLGDNSHFGKPKKFLLFDRFTTDYPASSQQSDTPSGEALFYYTDDYREVQDHFSQWDFVEVIPGDLPTTLATMHVESISFVHVDLNHPPTEIDCLGLLAPALLPGALILFDDSGNPGCQESLQRHQEWANEQGLCFLQLPTGQGLVQWGL